MQKRECFHVSVKKLDITTWAPAPRECATLTTIRNRAYLVGGLNHDAPREVSMLKVPGCDVEEIEDLTPEWINTTSHISQEQLL